MFDCRSVLLATCLLGYGHAIPAQPATTEWLIVPGERVGPINRATSEVMLVTLFGAANIEPVDVYLGEGFTEPGAAVYPGDPTRRVEIVWADAAHAAPKEVRLTGESSKWRTAEGISLGSTLKEIEGLNGSPFRLAGFAFDYGGTITDCGTGRLIILGCVDRSQPRLLLLRLSPSAEARSQPEYRQVVGDRDFSSGHPAMQSINPSVHQMIVSLSR